MRRPSPTTVIACLALFFAVAGGSAIALNGRNTVDSGDIKRKAVKTSDLANNAVTTRKIKANAVRSGDIRNGQVGRADLAPAEPLHALTAGELGNGGEGDCIWSFSNPAFPFPFRPSPPGYYKDALGYVHLTGLLFPVDGPGGDATCGGAGGEVSEDSVAFILPEGYRPTNDVLGGAAGGGAIVIGATPLSDPPQAWPAGAVASFSGGPAILLDNVVFEPAGVSGGVPRRAPSRSARASAGGGSAESLAELFG